MIHIPEFIKYFQQQSKPRGVVYYTCENPWCRYLALSGSRSSRIVFDWTGSPWAAVRVPVSGSRPVAPCVPPWARPCPSHPIPSVCGLSVGSLHTTGDRALSQKKGQCCWGCCTRHRMLPSLVPQNRSVAPLPWAGHP